MLEFNSKLFKALQIAILLLVVSACAQPAHKNTMPWQLSVAYTEIRIVAPNQYLLDGLFFERRGLNHWLTERQQAGLTLPLLLTSSDEMNLLTRRNYFEMATIAETAEKLGFEIYYSSAGLIQYKTSSQELLALADNQNQPLSSIFDPFSF